MERIRIAVVEDDDGWLKAITSLLKKQEDIDIRWVASNAADAVALASINSVDVILMDLSLGGNNCDGIYAVHEIKQFSDVKIIMLTSHVEKELIQNAFAVGACNYVLKENYDEIPYSIRSACRSFLPMDVLTQEFRRLKKEEQLKPLTQAERDVYELIEKGYTRPEIEDKLVKTENTVKTQIKNILSKFGVKSTKEAIRKVNLKGLEDKEG